MSAPVTTRTTADRDRLLRQIADHIAELVDPIQHTERYHTWSRNRNRIWRTHTTWHQPLLHELRTAVQSPPLADHGTGRGTPGSRPPANLDAIDRYTAIIDQLAMWRARLAPPSRSEPDTELRALAGTAVTADTATLAQLAGDVARWRTWCRILGGWQDYRPRLPAVPCPVCDTMTKYGDLPGGLRVHFGRKAAMCMTCDATWDESTVGVLADHIRHQIDRGRTTA